MGRWVTSKGRRFYILDKGEENPFASKPENQEADHKQYLNQHKNFKDDGYDEQVRNDNAIKASSGGGWDFRGIGQNVDKLEKQLSNTKSHNTVATIYRRLRSLDSTLTKEMRDTGSFGDSNAALTYRRRIRQMIKKIEGMNIL